MAPLNLKEWHSVLSMTDRLIGANDNTALDSLRASDANNREPVVYGRDGHATLCVKDKMIISVTVKTNTGGIEKQITATRTSIAHSIRRRHSPWWKLWLIISTSGAGENEFETECGCSMEDLRQDLPRPYVTQFEDQIFAHNDGKISKYSSSLHRSQQDLAASQKELAELRQEVVRLRKAMETHHEREVKLEKEAEPPSERPSSYSFSRSSIIQDYAPSHTH